jgi:hypothetical protein
MSRIVTVVLIYHRHKPTSIDLIYASKLNVCKATVTRTTFINVLLLLIRTPIEVSDSQFLVTHLPAIRVALIILCIP